ncbi:hypothetical protein [Phenylobacterium sp.]|uniref:hypothetical protein n=1 Tax=Phenylobacterium sp. TaxID=1871053 RepID=UPI002C3FFFD1|nr:hypothetical protein [Phenylobacterium sp.]HLZ76495.1 hypothetical protein [Phenylobacterium sp.]
MPHSPISSGPDDIEAHPRHTGHRWFDLILALSAIFISAVSLAVAIEHGRTERDLVAASSWPFVKLMLSNEYSEGEGHQFAAFGAINGGVGPAKLQSFEVFFKGQAMRSGADLLRHCCGLGPTPEDFRRELPHGFHYEITDRTVMRPGETMVTFGAPRGTDVGDRLAGLITGLTFRACYCSILDQCYVGNMRDTRVEAVKTCPEPKVRFDPASID